MVLAHNTENRTQDVQISQNITFDTMLLSPRTLQGLANSGFYKPSPIQLHGIPLGKCGFDLLLEAKSGTGKTAVFTVITLEKIDLKIGLQTVILAPTREIAAQICDVIKLIGSAYKGLHTEVVMGGLPVQDDIDKFNKNNVHIVVGSPGRLKHLIQDKHIDMSAVRLLILDEADKLMEKSFLTDIKYIFSNLPRQKQVILSSATFPESSKEFVKQFVQEAQHICPENNSVLLGVSQKITCVKYNSNIIKQTKLRYEELLKIIKSIQFKQCLIFCNYQVRVAELQRMLTKANWPVEMLHGQQEQSDRLDALKTLQEYKCRILISTDLASRGIDASNIDLVINFEPPHEWQTYLHRIGRAGRFGSYGTAITIVSDGNEQNKFLQLFESLNTSSVLESLWDKNTPTKSKNDLCIENEMSKNTKDVKDQEPISIDDLTVNDNDVLEKTIVNDCIDLLFTPSTSTVEIESFTELIQSYENFTITDESKNSEYRHVPVPKVVRDNISEPPLNKIENVSNNKLKNNINSKICSNKKYGESTKTNLESSIAQQLNIEDITQDTSYPTSIRKSNVIDEDEIIKDMERMGLPTAFGRSKHNNVNRRNDKHNVQVDRSYVQKRDEEGPSKCKYEIPKSTHHKPRRSINDENKDQLLKPNVKNGYEHINYERNEVKKKISQSKVNKNNLYDRVDKCDINVYNNRYVTWYNQLKLRTKQIEIALYIQELSNI